MLKLVYSIIKQRIWLVLCSGSKIEISFKFLVLGMKLKSLHASQVLSHWSTPTPNLQNFLTAAPLLITVGSCITPGFMLRSNDDSGYLLVIPQKPTVWLEGRGLMLSGISWTSRMGVALKLNSVTWLMPCIYSRVMPVCVYEHALGGQRPTWVSFPRCLSCFYLTGASWLDQQVSRRALSLFS